MNKSKTNDMVTLKTRWQDKNQNQYHTWFHYRQPDWLHKPSHNTNTLLVSNWQSKYLPFFRANEIATQNQSNDVVPFGSHLIYTVTDNNNK